MKRNLSERTCDFYLGIRVIHYSRKGGKTLTKEANTNFPEKRKKRAKEQRKESTDDLSIFDRYLKRNDKLFKADRDMLRPIYIPEVLPHREDKIEEIVSILSSSFRGATPSNIFIYGKTGTGKTAVVKYIENEIKKTQKQCKSPSVKIRTVYINCEVVDTHYSAFSNIGNNLSSGDFNDLIPFTGWPIDRVYAEMVKKIENTGSTVIVILDEISKLVFKSGDSVLYHLSRINSELKNSKVSIIGISNDLTFVDMIDARVWSTLSVDEIIFPPYDSDELYDILKQRAEMVFHPWVVSDAVLKMCAAYAAQENGDARRALELLRKAAEAVERSDDERITEVHIYKGQSLIEKNRVIQIVKSLPIHSKLVLIAILSLNRRENRAIIGTTGEVFRLYEELCYEANYVPLTQRRVSDLISELDKLGLINAVLTHKGRYGTTREIQLDGNRKYIVMAFEKDSFYRELLDYTPAQKKLI